MAEAQAFVWFSGLGPWLSAAFVALMGFWMLGAYNRLMRLRNAVAQAWAPVQAQLERRAQALPEMVAALREPLASEHRALDAVLTQQLAVQAAAAAFKGPKKAAVPMDAARALVQALGALDAALERLLALMDQHAELRSHSALATLKRELHDVDLRLAIARQNFNDAAALHDEAVLQWPTQALARLYGFALAGRL